jgi:hypothetical protein
MSPDDRDPEEHESAPYETEPPRSVFSALWFRVVLVIIVVGVVAAVAVPYVLEWMSPPSKITAARPAAPGPKPPAAPAPAAPAPMPAAPAPALAPPTPAATAPEKKAPPAATALAPAAPQPSAPPVVKTPAPMLEDKPATPAPAKGARKQPARKPAKVARTAPAATGGAYFVQVGAFSDPEHARRVAGRLRADRFRVEESMAAGQERSVEPAPAPEPAAAAGGDRYDVFVTGAPAADINAKLSAKGLATAAAGNGVVVKPSLPLRDAVALSKDLAVEGLKVQVRRASGAASAARAPAPAPAAPGGEGLHRVRVGPFPDRATATEALNALRDRGYKDSFIARGGA